MLVVRCAGLPWQWAGKYSDPPSRLCPVAVWDVVCCCGLIAAVAVGWILFINWLVASDLMCRKLEWHAAFGLYEENGTATSACDCLSYARWHVRWGLPGSGLRLMANSDKGCWFDPNRASECRACLPLLQAWCLCAHAAYLNLEAYDLHCFTSQRFCLIPALRSTTKLRSLITVSNKVILQNQLRNLYAKNPEESNETFDRVIRRWLL